jgi:membrane fusion protein (multidrug efflux system)
MRSFSFTGFVIGALLAIFSVAAGGCTNGTTAPATKQEAGAANAAAPGGMIRLERSALPQQVKLPGQLASFEEVSIFPKVNGYVKDVWVDIGSHVKKGQLLMELEAPELQQATTQAKERYARAKLDYTISEENYERMKQAA